MLVKRREKGVEVKWGDTWVSMTPTPLTLLLIVSSNFVYADFQFKEAIQVLHAYVILEN